MPLYEVHGTVMRTGMVTVEAEDANDAREKFVEHFTDDYADGLQYAEEGAPVVNVTACQETDGVYFTV